jgi:hypothetical protein
MRSRNTGHVDPHARARPTFRAVVGLLLFMLVVGVLAYLAARFGLL